MKHSVVMHPKNYLGPNAERLCWRIDLLDVVFAECPARSISPTFYELLLRAKIPKVPKRQSSHQCLFELLGSAHKMLVKLTPGLVNFTNIVCTTFSTLFFSQKSSNTSFVAHSKHIPHLSIFKYKIKYCNRKMNIYSVIIIIQTVSRKNLLNTFI
jgi:hypothetical protein